MFAAMVHTCASGRRVILGGTVDENPRVAFVRQMRTAIIQAMLLCEGFREPRRHVTVAHRQLLRLLPTNINADGEQGILLGGHRRHERTGPPHRGAQQPHWPAQRTADDRPAPAPAAGEQSVARDGLDRES